MSSWTRATSCSFAVPRPSTPGAIRRRYGADLGYWSFYLKTGAPRLARRLALRAYRHDRRDPEAMWAELQAILASLQDPDLRRLMRAIFDDPDVAARFRKAPAAKSIHHAWLGGLLEHNLSVYRVIEGLCAHYASEAPGLLDRDLCVAGGLLHDFGKIDELSAEGGAIEYTHEGKLIGHLVQCALKLAAVAATLPGFPQARLTALQHIVLAHHDRLDFGSPKTPMTAEAFVVHAADQLDSRLCYLRQLCEREPAGWSSYQKVFDRPFFLPRLPRPE